MTTSPPPPAGSERERIDRWLEQHVGLEGPLRSTQIPGGLSNVTSIVTDASGQRVVVRRPPDGKLSGGAHDVLREARIIDALVSSEVPVPTVLGTCDDVTVSDVPFYVMDHVDGIVIESSGVVESFADEARHRLGLELMDLLSALQRIDLDAAGLQDMCRSTPYLQRQIRRWKTQWEASATREVPAVDRVARRLEEILPTLEAQPDRLVHGDFRLGNVMVSKGPQPTIIALLDWELATTGHPLADLGFVGARMHAPEGVLEGGIDPSSVPGSPSFDELAAHFAMSGVSTTDLPVFVALSAWRWAVIVEGIQKRFESGQMGDAREDAAWHRHRVELLAGFAADWLP